MNWLEKSVVMRLKNICFHGEIKENVSARSAYLTEFNSLHAG